MIRHKMLTLQFVDKQVITNKECMTKDINSSPFDEGTKIKLDIFRRCFREWYPVFVHDLYTTHLFVFDMFAGSGMDPEGHPGSPLILLDEAKGAMCQHCKSLKSNSNGKKVFFVFNEYLKPKFEALKNNVSDFQDQCMVSNNCSECPIKKGIRVRNEDFKDLLADDKIDKVLKNNEYGKFVLIDQYGIKQVTEEVFSKLISFPKTDFIFFISSSTINRFKEFPAIQQYFDVKKINFDDAQPKECHRLIKEYFEDLIPCGKDYYLHSFTIKKGSNYYGLIFGTSHSLGMEKFLKVCWEEDRLSGDSNCNIDNDYEEGSLFYNESETQKKVTIKQEMTDSILNGNIKDNISGLKYALRRGCQPSLFVEVISSLKKRGKIDIIGTFNSKATCIHKIKPDGKDYYRIRII